jgi:hypothetical protein
MFLVNTRPNREELDLLMARPVANGQRLQPRVETLYIIAESGYRVRIVIRARYGIPLQELIVNFDEFLVASLPGRHAWVGVSESKAAAQQHNHGETAES